MLADMHVIPTTLIGLVLAVSVGLPITCRADGDDHDDDHARAREALLAGEVVPLESIVAKAEAATGGSVIDVEIENERDEPHHRHQVRGEWSGFTYEVKLLLPDGRLIKQEYDARTGVLLREKRRR